jgi:hypothetical protein
MKKRAEYILFLQAASAQKKQLRLPAVSQIKSCVPARVMGAICAFSEKEVFHAPQLLSQLQKNNKFTLAPINPKNPPLTKKNNAAMHIGLFDPLNLPKLVKRSKFLVFFRNLNLHNLKLIIRQLKKKRKLFCIHTIHL